MTSSALPGNGRSVAENDSCRSRHCVHRKRQRCGNGSRRTRIISIGNNQQARNNVLLVLLVASVSIFHPACAARPLGDSALQPTTAPASTDRPPLSLRNNGNKPKPISFFSKWTTRVAFLRNGTTLAGTVELDYEGSNRTTTDLILEHDSLLARVVASTKKNQLAMNTLAEQLRIKFEQLTSNNQTNTTSGISSFDWMGAVSTTSSSSTSSSCAARSITQGCRGGGSTASGPDMNALDRLARGLVLNLGKIVAFQSVATWLRGRETDWIQEVCSCW